MKREREAFCPKGPSREMILRTIGDPGEDRWRNPVHVKAVKDGWPKREHEPEGQERRAINGMEKTLHWNGSLT